MTTETDIRHCGWRTDGGGKLHRLKFTWGPKAICGRIISAFPIPRHEFETLVKCKKCFPNQEPPKTP